MKLLSFNIKGVTKQAVIKARFIAPKTLNIKKNQKLQLKLNL